jgi:hypothetical protein
MAADVTPGAVLIRSRDPELQLQGLRTALSLSMGDRPATVYLAGDGAAVLDSSAGSEAGQNLEALGEAGVAVVAERQASASRAGQSTTVRVHLVARDKIIERVAAAEFQQTF